jgi:hypothetical protein
MDVYLFLCADFRSFDHSRTGGDGGGKDAFLRVWLNRSYVPPDRDEHNRDRVGCSRLLQRNDRIGYH